MAKARRGIVQRAGRSKRGHVPGDHPPYVELEIFAENQQPQVIRVSFDLKELVTNKKLVVEAKAGE